MNKKGFTLAELLGVIVILLLLVLIVTPLAMNYSKKASDSVYDVQIKAIKDGAREWSSDKDNILLIPTEENECIEVSLEKLKEAGYLDYNIKNPKTNEKFDDNLTVIIRREGKNLTYTFNEDGTQVCSTVVTTDYPKWVYISSSPTIASSQTEVTVNIESNKKISEYNLLPENIQVKVGSTINENANVTVYCNNGTKLSCELKLSNLEGDGRLSLVIDKDVMKDEDLNPSRKTNLLTDTIVDSKGPTISYKGKTNTNPSLYYATKDDTVEIKFKAEDEQGIVNNLTKDDIRVFLDGVEISCEKELTTSGSGNTLDYNLKLTNVTGSGKLSIKIPTGKVADSLGNTNNEKSITPGITFDNIKPIISFEPNEEARYLLSITPTIFATDNETGVDDSTIKYIISTDPNATPNTSISNGGEITISGVTGDYYIVGYACDYAGNCDKVPSGIYHMNNDGPMIEISPNESNGWAKTVDIKIIVTARGAALDEGSFVYTISTDVNAEPNQTFINDTNLNIPVLTGIYYINAKACDMDGNCSQAVSNKYYFDNQAPEITYNPNGTYNTSTGYYWTKNLDVNIRVQDNVELDWSKYVVSTSKTTAPTENITNGEITFKPDDNPTKTGIYYIVVKACDKLGNCSQTNSNKYQFDNEIPGIGNVSFIENATDKTLTAKVTITDNIALKKYEIYKPNGTKDAEGTISDNKNSYNVEYVQNVAGNYKIKVYDHLDNVSEQQFTVPSYKVEFKSANTSQGTVATATRNVNYGAKASTAITPATGYHYNGVSCTNNQTASHNNGTVTTGQITSATTCTVSFAINRYDVTFESNNVNFGTVNPGTATVNHGANATSTATAKECCYISGVSGTGCSISGTTVKATNIIETGRKCTVNFAKNTYPVTFAVNNTSMGSLNPSGVQNVEYDSSISSTVTINSGYKIKSVSGCTLSGNKVTVSNVKSARTCTVTFEPSEYTITYNLDGGTNNSSNPSKYSPSSAVTLQTPTKTGNTFLGWTGSNGSTPQLSVTIPAGSTGNKTYTANWEINKSPNVYIYEPYVRWNASAGKGEAIFQAILDNTPMPTNSKYQYATSTDGVNWSSWKNDCEEDSMKSCKIDFSLANASSKIYIKARFYESSNGHYSPESRVVYVDPERLYLWQIWEGLSIIHPEYKQPVGNRNILIFNFEEPADGSLNAALDAYRNRYASMMGEYIVGVYINSFWLRKYEDVGGASTADVFYRGIIGRYRGSTEGSDWIGYINKAANGAYVYRYGDNQGNPIDLCVSMGVTYSLFGIAASDEAKFIYNYYGLGQSSRFVNGLNECITQDNCSTINANPDNYYCFSRHIKSGYFE